jgi:hypothetical protein
MKMITITLPGDLGADIISKVAKLRRNKQRVAARQGNGTSMIDEKKSDVDFIVSDILQSLITDYTQMVKSEAMQEAAKKAGEELDAKLAGI